MSDIEFKIGADPELFLKDKETGKFVSAHGMIEGTKEEPLKVDHGAVQVDGMALEFNIDPATTEDEFVRNISSVINTLRGMVDEKYEFVFTPVADFGADYIDAQPEVARRLGCTPDYDAYKDGKANPTPDAEMPFRTASGHVHVGWTTDQDIADPDHIEACNMLVKQLDVYLGCPSGLWDLDKQDGFRRQLYGKAGAYRPKSYGVEYRVLSNLWLNEENTIRYVFQATKEAFDQLINGVQVYNNHSERDIKKVVNANPPVVRTGYNIVTYSYNPPLLREIYNKWARPKDFKKDEWFEQIKRYSTDDVGVHDWIENMIIPPVVNAAVPPALDNLVVERGDRA